MRKGCSECGKACSLWGGDLSQHLMRELMGRLSLHSAASISWLSPYRPYRVCTFSYCPYNIVLFRLYWKTLYQRSVGMCQEMLNLWIETTASWHKLKTVYENISPSRDWQNQGSAGRGNWQCCSVHVFQLQRALTNIRLAKDIMNLT